MQKLALCILLAFSLDAAAADSNYAASSDNIVQVKKTRFGPLTVTYGNWGGVQMAGRIIFHGKTILNDPLDYTLEDRFELGRTDVVFLVGDSRHQTPEIYSFILVGPDGKAKVVTSRDFESSDMSAGHTARQEGNRLIVDLGYESGKKKVAILADCKLSIQLLETDSKMDIEDCKALHRLVATDCMEPRKRCDKAYPGGSYAEDSFLIPAENQPGYNEAGMNAACQAACRKKAAPPFDAAFKKNVCGL